MDNVEKRRARHKKFVNKTRKSLFDRLGNKCACCGEVETGFLVVDHKENDGGQHRKETGKRGYQMYRLMLKDPNLLDKYQLLCANCNHSKRMNEGVCVHQTYSGISRGTYPTLKAPSMESPEPLTKEKFIKGVEYWKEVIKRDEDQRITGCGLQYR